MHFSLFNELYWTLKCSSMHIQNMRVFAEQRTKVSLKSIINGDPENIPERDVEQQLMARSSVSF